MDRLCERLREQVLEQMDFSKEMEESELKELIARVLAACGEVTEYSLKDRVVMEQRVFNSLRRLDVLQELVDDDEVTEILVNGPNCIFYEKGGTFYVSHFGSRFISVPGCRSTPERENLFLHHWNHPR